MRVRWMAVFPVSYQVNLFLRRVLTFGTCHSPCHFRVGLNSSSPDFSTVSPSRMWPLAKFVALSSRVAVLLSHCFLSTDGERNHVCGAKCAASGTFRFVQWPSVWKHRKGAYSLAPVGKAQLSIFPLRRFLSAQHRQEVMHTYVSETSTSCLELEWLSLF